MLAAVALAFGVQAAGSWWEGTSFESLNADTDLDLTSGEGLMWETNGVPKEMKVVDITGASMSGFSRANYYRNETLRRALSVKTNFGEPVFRTNTTEKTMGTLYVDTLVKPTIAEDDSSFTNEAKIAIWFKEVCNSEDIPIATNLMIRAGYIKADGTCVATNYNCGAVTGADEWQRFTIKSFEDITTGAGYPGFVVFRNGRAVQCASDKGDSNATAFNYLDTQPGLYHKYDQLFPSADTTSTTITKIGFDGTGIVAGYCINIDDGLLIPGAEVTLTGSGGSYSAITDADGYYQIVNVPVGDYDITADEILGGIVPKVNKQERAAELLRELSAKHQMLPSKEIFGIAREENISKRTMDIAKQELGIKARRMNDVWYWILRAGTE